MPVKKILIVGLGNPGEKYKGSPHNAGFLVIDELAKSHELDTEENKKLKSEIALTGSVILAKPMSFMNSSGTPVKLLIAYYSLPVTQSLWLVHDDVDLELGKLKIAKNRGSAGHKGVEDIIQKLSTKDFIRFRIGVRPGHLPQKRSRSIMNKFVTGAFTKSQNKIFTDSVAKCKEAVLFALENGVEKAASKYNQK